MTSVALESIVAIDGQQRLKRLGAACVVLFVCVVALYVTGFFDAQRFIEGGPAIQQLASEMVPPNFERWEHWVIPLRDTLAMSIAGTALTVLASLPLALVAAPNTAPNAVVGRIVRTILAAFRSVPEIILGILFVAAVGFGALPGVLALALHSTGMVAKFYAEAIEHVDPKPLEA
ncbi:MAG: phosphonate ABC transporter, permease protein PhnE, partial [Burkholderiales bacterium RIFCSPHIGHO2_12_FULL_65_48]